MLGHSPIRIGLHLHLIGWRRKSLADSLYPQAGSQARRWRRGLAQVLRVTLEVILECLINAKAKQLNRIPGQIQQQHTHEGEWSAHYHRLILLLLLQVRNCTGDKVDGLLHKTKEQTKTRIAIPPQPPQAKRTQTRERPSSALLPARDPLLHPAMITPPCPIPEGQQQTPVELRSYMHISETRNIYIRILYDLQLFFSLQDNKFINCILTCRLGYFFFLCRCQISRII